MMKVENKSNSEFLVNVGSTALNFCIERALHLPSIKTLIIADPHFGKVNHFRRAGLPVPPVANHRNAERLIELVINKNPVRVIFLGDLFHSVYNDDWEVLGQIVRHFPSCTFDLILGNHDILSDQQYQRMGINLFNSLVIGNLLLTHEPLQPEDVPPGQLNVAGHLHPAARLAGKGRQSLVLPCFWLSSERLVLPAFGSFTGLAPIYPDGKDTVYVIVEDRIMKLSPANKVS